MAKRKLIYSTENGGMLDDWTEELYCTKCKDGSFSLQEVQVIWDDVTKRIIRPRMPSIRGIRSLKRFANELSNLERFDYQETSEEAFAGIVNKLISLDKNFFKGLKDLMEEIYKEKEDEEQKNWDGYVSAMERRAKELRERAETSFNRSIKNKDLEVAYQCLGDTSYGFLHEYREAVIISLGLNYYESENPKDFFPKKFLDVSEIKSFIQNFDENYFFKNEELTDFGKESVQTIKNAQIRLKRKR